MWLWCSGDTVDGDLDQLAQAAKAAGKALLYLPCEGGFVLIEEPEAPQ